MGVEASASAAGVGLAPPLVVLAAGIMAMPELRRKPIGLSSRLAVLVLGDDTYVCILYFSPRTRKMIKPNFARRRVWASTTILHRQRPSR